MKNIQLEPTGERVIDDAYTRTREAYTIYAMHMASYAFAEQWCMQKKVLDLGCGSGYGTARISQLAAEVVGVDVSEEAVQFARARYSAPNLSFDPIDGDTPLPYPDHSFDVVLSFQVIEHVRDEQGYLSEARRVLRPGGTMLIITPDRKHRLFPGQRPWNRWHIREYSAASLSGLIGSTLHLERMLQMGAEWPVAKTEILRYRKTKWLTLPFTLPFLPEYLRQKGLNILHKLKGRAPAVAANSNADLPSYGFDEGAFVISPDAPNSMNLVAIAKRT